MKSHPKHNPNTQENLMIILFKSDFFIVKSSETLS